MAFEDRIPLNQIDTVVYEMAMKFGRADIVVFHVDGSCSVIEVKDGTRGYSHIVSGIGQACLYATQIAMKNDAVKSVRKCLLWTSTGDLFLDSVIEDACLAAKTIPMPWPPMKGMMETAFRGSDLRREKCQD